MSDDSKKKYYYMRLKEDFFDDDRMKIIEGMPNGEGYAYENLLLKLYLKSLRGDGRLSLTDTVPYTSSMIASITGHSVGTVEKALEIFQQFGLVEILDTGAIYMSDIQNYIGQSSNEADRKRLYRDRIEKERKQLEDKSRTKVRTYVGQTSDKFRPEIRDKSTEIRDKSTEIRGSNTSSPEQNSGKKTKPEAAEPEADVEAVILNDGSEWRPPQSLYEELCRLAPNVDVKYQFRRMRLWCIKNPKKRKTSRGVKRFVTGWIDREQNSGRNGRGSSGQQEPFSSLGEWEEAVNAVEGYGDVFGKD